MIAFGARWWSCGSLRCRKTFSSTITAPSTMMPKSIAPSDSRLAGMPRIREADERRQQRQRNDDGDDAGGAEVAQEEIQHDGHQQRAFEQIPEHRAAASCRSASCGRRTARSSPAFGRIVSFSAATRSLTAASTSRRVLALPHQHDARHDLVLVVLADEALAGHGADVDRRRCRGSAAACRRARRRRCRRCRRSSAACRCRESGTAARPARGSCRRRWRCRGRAP